MFLSLGKSAVFCWAALTLNLLQMLQVQDALFYQLSAQEIQYFPLSSTRVSLALES